eukprot:scaffold86271_cov40-Phaeocystis_antarctica.AAC.1
MPPRPKSSASAASSAARFSDAAESAAAAPGHRPSARHTTACTLGVESSSVCRAAAATPSRGGPAAGLCDDGLRGGGLHSGKLWGCDAFCPPMKSARALTRPSSCGLAALSAAMLRPSLRSCSER